MKGTTKEEGMQVMTDEKWIELMTEAEVESMTKDRMEVMISEKRL